MRTSVLLTVEKNQKCVQSLARLSMCLLLYLLQVVKTVQGALRISRQEVAPSKWSKKWLGKQRMLLQLKNGNTCLSYVFCKKMFRCQ